MSFPFNEDVPDLILAEKARRMNAVYWERHGQIVAYTEEEYREKVGEALREAVSQIVIEDLLATRLAEWIEKNLPDFDHEIARQMV